MNRSSTNTFIPGPTPKTVRTAEGNVLTAPDGWVLRFDYHEVAKAKDRRIVLDIVNANINLTTVGSRASFVYSAIDVPLVNAHPLKEISPQEIPEQHFAMTPRMAPVYRWSE